MKYYAMQVKTGDEDRFIALFRKMYPAFTLQLYFPRRTLLERKSGEAPKLKNVAVFPGYIFAALTETEKLVTYRYSLRRMEGFQRFLPANTRVLPLDGDDLKIVLHFLKDGTGIAGISKVYFNEDDKIVVVEGALQGLEGNIIRVDRRKGRAKIRVDLCRQTFTMDLSFEILQKREK